MIVTDVNAVTACQHLIGVYSRNCANEEKAPFSRAIESTMRYYIEKAGKDLPFDVLMAIIKVVFNWEPSRTVIKLEEEKLYDFAAKTNKSPLEKLHEACARQGE